MHLLLVAMFDMPHLAPTGPRLVPTSYGHGTMPCHLLVPLPPTLAPQDSFPEPAPYWRYELAGLVRRSGSFQQMSTVSTMYKYRHCIEG